MPTTPTRILLTLLTLTLLLSPLTTSAQNKRPKKPAVSQQTLDLYKPGQFKTLNYRLMLPIDFDPNKTYPLILSLHGAGGKGTGNIQNLRNWNEWLTEESLRRKHPCFILAPQTTMSWSDPTANVPPEPKVTDALIATLPEAMHKFAERQKASVGKPPEGDLGTVLEFIDTVLTQKYKIDTDRVYCIGHSMGGFGTFTTIYQHPNRFAAAIPSAGGFHALRDPNRIKNIPIWIFHGDADPIIPYIYSSTIFNELKKLNANTKFTTLANVKHNASTYAFTYKGDNPQKGYITAHASNRTDKEQDIWNWLFKQKRK